MFERPLAAQNESSLEDEKVQEGLQKIETVRKEAPSAIVRDLLGKEVRAAEERAWETIAAKHPELIWGPDIDDPSLPEDGKAELRRGYKGVVNLAQEMDAAELLQRARSKYEGVLKDKRYSSAWDLANFYLDKDAVTEAGRLAIESLRTEMRDNGLDLEKRIDAAETILDERYYKGVDRTDDERLGAAEKLVALEGPQDPNGCWRRLKSSIKSRPLPKSAEVLAFARPFAVREIENLLKSTLYRDEASRLAERYELAGFIDIEADHELFDRLTAKR